MKTIKRMLVAILSIVCLVLTSVSLVACTAKYTVSYDLGEYDGAGVAPQAQTVKENSDITLPQVGVIWDGHEFAGWKIGNEILDSGARYTVTADVTAVAEWTDTSSPIEPVKYTITYDLGVYDGDGVAPASRTVVENTAITLPQVGVTWEGYIFTGWKIDSETLDAGARYTVTADVTAVAQWVEAPNKATKYTVSYDLGEYRGIGIAPTSQTVEEGSVITLPTVGVMWEGYYFAGWKIGNYVYPAGTNYVVSADVTAVAEWYAVQMDWTPYVGLYSGIYDGTRYVIEITATDVTVKIDGKPAEVTFEFRLNAYDTYQFDLTINGKAYAMFRGDTASDPTVEVPAIMLLDANDVYFSLMRVQSENDCPWQHLIGKYEGEEIVSGDTYTVDITANAITVKINGVSAKVVLLDYNPYADYDFVLTINGVEFFLMDYNGASLLLQTSDVSTAMALLDRVQMGGVEPMPDDPNKDDPSKDDPGKDDPDAWNDNAQSPIFNMDYVGTWQGLTNNDDVWVVEIETNAIYVTVNGGERARAWVTGYDFDFMADYITFTLKGIDGEFKMNPIYLEGTLRIYGGADNIDFTLKNVEDGVDQPGNNESGDKDKDDDTAVYTGNYTVGDYQYTSFAFDIDNMKLTYTYVVNGSEQTATTSLRKLSGWAPSSGYEGAKSDYTYFAATLNSSDDGTMYSFFVANDGSTMYLCNYTKDEIIATYTPAN